MEINITLYIISAVLIVLSIIILIISLFIEDFNIRSSTKFMEKYIYNPASGRNYETAEKALALNPNTVISVPKDIKIVGSLCSPESSYKELAEGPLKNKDKLQKIISSSDDTLYSQPYSIDNIKTNIGIGAINKSWNELLDKFDMDALLFNYEKMAIPQVNKIFNGIAEVPYSELLLGYFNPWPYKPIYNIIYGPRCQVFYDKMNGLIMQKNDKSNLIDHIELYNTKQLFIPMKSEENGNWIRYSVGNIPADSISLIRFVDKDGKDIYEKNDIIIWAVY